MVQIPILNGIYANGVSDLRTSYPRNLVPVPKDNGISKGYLRPAEGMIQQGTGPDIDRGGINWNGICYRVMGSKLVKVFSDGSYSILGDVGTDGQPVTFDYSFDRLAIASAYKLWYWNGTTLTQVTDPDLGAVVDVVWVDGYFMTTDGTSLIVTDLNDPTTVNPLKYGSSEADPDPIKGVIKLRNEIYAMNRNTVEVFQNVGGSLFPFQRIDGAQMMRGMVGTHAGAVFMEAIAYVGSGRNEAPAVWLGANGQTAKLSTREIEQILAGYPESTLAQIECETRVVNYHQFFYIHLPDQTLVYDGVASQGFGEPVWHILTSGLESLGQYRARHFVWCYDKWLCADPTQPIYGYLTDTVASHYGDLASWEFGTTILYNEGRGALFHELELVALMGNGQAGADSTIWTSYSTDGVTWSQEKPRSAGMMGQRNKRITWLRQGFMRNWRIQKFRGTSDAFMSFARLEAQLEPLNV